MKALLLTLSVLASQSVFANTSVIALNERHAAVINKAILAECGPFRNLEVKKNEAQAVKVDQGITDYTFTTVLTGEQKQDQFMFDTYVITVKSVYSDSYDHSAQDWGSFSVESVTCLSK